MKASRKERAKAVKKGKKNQIFVGCFINDDVTETSAIGGGTMREMETAITWARQGGRSGRNWGRNGKKGRRRNHHPEKKWEGGLKKTAKLIQQSP